MINTELLAEVYTDIILGRGVKRIVHDLHYEGQPFVDLFIEQLRQCDYLLTPLRSIDPGVGFRIPGFYIQDGKAYFGHLFWEVFSATRKRKIWGSVERNSLGDWAIILTGNGSREVYLNTSIRQEVDIFYLT